jgi:hypothetical protein
MDIGPSMGSNLTRVHLHLGLKRNCDSQVMESVSDNPEFIQVEFRIG